MTPVGIHLGNDVDRGFLDEPRDGRRLEPAPADRYPLLVVPGRQQSLGEAHQDVGAAPLARVQTSEQQDRRRLRIAAADPDRTTFAVLPAAVRKLDEPGRPRILPGEFVDAFVDVRDRQVAACCRTPARAWRTRPHLLETFHGEAGVGQRVERVAFAKGLHAIPAVVEFAKGLADDLDAVGAHQVGHCPPVLAGDVHALH